MKKDAQEWFLDLNKIIQRHFFKSISQASDEELQFALANEVSNRLIPQWEATRRTWSKEKVKILYYFSAEFLMGRWLGNALMNMGIYDYCIDDCSKKGQRILAIEESEREPGLGNGGLGRLAACFLDSLATLDYPCMGYGIRYRYGMFKQKIKNFEQKELPDDWLTNGDAYCVCRRDRIVNVAFGGHVRSHKDAQGRYIYEVENAEIVQAMPYDMPVVGYNTSTVGTLRLWEAHSENGFNLEMFQAEEYQKAVEQQNHAENISRVLYPNDQGILGKNLRLRQEFFFVSASLQDIIRRFKTTHGTHFEQFPDAVAIQLNDTHPVITIPELMRLLIDEENLSWDEAWQITIKTCAYTNHTILSEAMEKWPVDLMASLLPRQHQIIEEINHRFMTYLRQVYKDSHTMWMRMSIISHGYVNMAFLAIIGSHSVNGVSALHTQILKDDILADWYHLFPEKFNNKTNGVTHRRWLLKANPELSQWITSKIGDQWIADMSKTTRLEDFMNDEKALQELMAIKHHNKIRLAEYIKETTAVQVDPNAIFDVQVKRFHEYKRQLLNALHILYLYNKILKDSNFKMHPRVFIFAGKAASGYKEAKIIIKLVNAIADMVNNDARLNGMIKVVFLENYNVGLAEKIFPASDVSEQISTAGYEASGTGNMKFMMNGALTLGTFDGANVEIVDAVGMENAFIFGLRADEVREKQSTHISHDMSDCSELAKIATNSLISEPLSHYGEEDFKYLYDELFYGRHGNPADKYMILDDFDAYVDASEALGRAYEDKKHWAQMCLKNIAHSGQFSSDRTIKEYAKEIWHLKAVKAE